MKTIIIAGVLLAATATASAREYEVSWGARVHESDSTSLDVVSASDFTSFVDGGVATRVGSLPILGRIWLGAHLSGGAWNATNFGDMDAQLSTLVTQVTARGVREVHPRLRAYVRADLGLGWSTLTLSRGETTLSDDATVLAAYAGAGIDAALLRASPSAGNPDLALALRLEAGWMHFADQSFSASPSRPDDGRNEIDSQDAPLGSVDASGLSLRIGLVGRF